MLKLRQLQQAPEQYAGPVEVCGWVRTVREGKAVGFIELTDGSAFKPVQIVYDNDEAKPRPRADHRLRHRRRRRAAPHTGRTAAL